MTSSSNTNKYIYELPFLERTELCRLLNRNDKWEELAGKFMGYDLLTVELLRKEKNPTYELLTLWGHHNHTILELFVLLCKIRYSEAMVLLKPFIDVKYYQIFSNGQHNLCKTLGKSVNKNTKDLKIGTQNFNQSTPPLHNVPKVIIEANTKEESHKILNQPMQALHIGTTPSNSNNLLVVSPVPPSHFPASLQNIPNISTKNNNSVPKIDATLPHASYSELGIATNGWNRHNILGKGGFGTVYRGTWKNTDVAVKKIEKRGPDADESYIVQLQQSLREIKILNSYPHENILALYAYSLGGEAPCLVYQLMNNGSLEDKLQIRHRCQPLSWMQRHEIAKGTARGLQYLHTIGEKPLIHGDIKSANILLDKNFEPKIGDFGLAREGPEKDSMKVSRIHGTRPYLPDEFLHGRRLSTKIDTYSYGIVLFEMATGLSAFDDSRSEHKLLKDFIDSMEDKDIHVLIDKKAGEKDKQVFTNLIVLGKWCANRLAQYRPEMDLVFRKLNDL